MEIDEDTRMSPGWQRNFNHTSNMAPGTEIPEVGANVYSEMIDYKAGNNGLWWVFDYVGPSQAHQWGEGKFSRFECGFQGESVLVEMRNEFPGGGVPEIVPYVLAGSSKRASLLAERIRNACLDHCNA